MGFCDWIFMESVHPVPVAFDSLCHCNDRAQSTVCRPEKPAFQIAFGQSWIIDGPEPGKGQLELIGTNGFEVKVLQTCQL